MAAPAAVGNQSCPCGCADSVGHKRSQMKQRLAIVTALVFAATLGLVALSAFEREHPGNAAEVPGHESYGAPGALQAAEAGFAPQNQSLRYNGNYGGYTVGNPQQAQQMYMTPQAPVAMVPATANQFAAPMPPAMPMAAQYPMMRQADDPVCVMVEVTDGKHSRLKRIVSR